MIPAAASRIATGRERQEICSEMRFNALVSAQYSNRSCNRKTVRQALCWPSSHRSAERGAAFGGGGGGVVRKMPTEPQRTCPTCGNEFSGAMEFCPVCLLRKGLAGSYESGESSASKDAVKLTSDQSAQRFENYEVMLDEAGRPIELGRGAMGVTYKAVDVDLRCPVTLKVISEQYLGDESARLRFLREARAAASVRHPNVASVFHLGRTGQNYFYAMEFVAGETLEKLIKRSGRLEVKLALEIATQVAAGLVAVHKQKLVHRDIKPSNVMVSLEDGGAVTAKLIDLGLAKGASEPLSEAAISMPGSFAGTPEFASPEQFAGIGADIRSDLYSLGVTLWEMLIGRVPFRGSPVEVMYQHQHAPLPVEQLNGIPQPLVLALEVLLAKDPVRRFQTPAELLKVMPTVRDAINAGRAMMKTIRVFVSSTGDVQKERHVAERVMRAIATEFNLPVSDSYSICQRLAEENGEPEKGEPKTEPDNHGPLVLCPYFLEHQRLALDLGYLGVMPNTAEFDLVICILWSRLGSLLAPSLRMPDGSAPASGTDCEIGWALDHAGKNKGVPPLRVYRNCSKPTPPLEPKEEREAFGRQWDSVQEFFARWEANSEGDFAGVFNEYGTLQEFEELFRGHFRDFLLGQIDQEARQKLLNRKARRWKSSPPDVQNGAHGTMRDETYYSTTLEKNRRVLVYTPPSYNRSHAPLPVLYLYHGFWDTRYSWVTEGRLAQILDNLLAEGKAVPMVVVVPEAHALPPEDILETNNTPYLAKNQQAVDDELFHDIIPFVETHYNISDEPRERAIAGLSMGGLQSIETGIVHLGYFRWIGAFSPGVRPAALSDEFKNALKDPNKINENLYLFEIFTADNDKLVGKDIAEFEARLKQTNIQHLYTVLPGTHSMLVGRQALVNFLQEIFKP